MDVQGSCTRRGEVENNAINIDHKLVCRSDMMTDAQKLNERSRRRHFRVVPARFLAVKHAPVLEKLEYETKGKKKDKQEFKMGRVVMNVLTHFKTK